MPNGNDDKLAAAKEALNKAKATFPSGNDGHAVGQQFAQAHGADHTGGTISDLAKQAGGDRVGIQARSDAMKQLLPQ